MIYFVASDIHSFYDEFIEALSTAGYNKDNPEHILIVCGDIFDRGPKSKEMFQFITSLPKERLILIKGNHEQLFLDLVDKHLPERHDFSNGTVNTICQLYAETSEEDELMYNRLCDGLYWGDYFTEFINNIDSMQNLRKIWKNITDKVKSSGVVKWLKSDVWKNYYELDKYIFVHSFIPLRNSSKTRVCGNFNYKDYLIYNENWRKDATEEEWKDAVWGCPWKQYQDGLLTQEENNGKTLVCGHWHTADFYKYLKNDDTPTTNIYFSKGIIGLDGGVTKNNYELIYECNVLVIKDGVCYNKYGDKLK